jgi:hypothetical protein
MILADIKLMLDLINDRCYKCHKKVIKPKIEVTDTIANIVCESYENCEHCGAVYDYFAYGNYERDSDKGYLESKYPKIWNFLERWKR